MPESRETETWRLFWAKTDHTDPGSNWTRPLWAHLIDVAHAALLLWETVLPRQLKQRIAKDLSVSERDAGYVLSFWIGLHDIGKAIPTFQELHEPSRVKLEASGLRFRGFTERKHHGHASIPILATWIKSDPNALFFEQIAAWIGAHHGRLYARHDWENDASNPAILGDAGWRSARHELLHAVQNAWFERYPVEQQLAPSRRTTPSWLVAFGGWATLADWLGSMASCYPRDTGYSLSAYLDASREGAGKAVRISGFDLPACLIDPGFGQLFAFTPNALQQAMIDLPLPQDDAPTLVIAEGPTGEGKTEGAFARAARQQAYTQGSGLYIAMPTQATSNGLLPRTLDFLKRAHRGNANFRLVHGNADLHPEQETLVSAVDDLDTLFDADDRASDDRLSGKVRTLQWFLPRKRSLLTPYGLGTVDQAFMGVLYARHFFLRLFALTGKTVIFDEIHAYDLYMQHLFGRLLRWLYALGTHVILLSATLPSSLRNACFKAWGNAICEVDTPSESIPYPAVWLVQNGKATLEAGGFPTRWGQQARLVRHDPSPEAVAQAAARACEDGAVALVVCNTVRRAQMVYRALPEAVRKKKNDVMLLHARFRFGLRQQTEATVLERFGKGRPNGQGGILIATQLAEQSLDLDADVLFTDLAPVDLLLQRAGRLHRHLEARPSKTRPEAYQTPVVYWLCPEAEPGHLPDIRDIGISTSRYTVYAPTIVWKTWLVLQGRETWSLPDDYRTLIEAVYAEEAAMPADLSESAQDVWTRGLELDAKLEQEAHSQAFHQLIPEPTPGGLRNLLDPDRVILTDEDDHDAHPSRRVLTRLGAESAEVVLLFENGDKKLYLDPACTENAPLMIPEGREDLPTESVRALLQNAVRISYEDIARALRERAETELPEAWRKAAIHTPALQQRHPLVLIDRTITVGRYRITEDAELGVCIESLK